MKGLLVVAALAGIGVEWLDQWLQRWSDRFAGDLGLLAGVAFALYFAPPLAVAGWLAVRFESFRWVIASAALLALTFNACASVVVFFPAFLDSAYQGWRLGWLLNLTGTVLLQTTVAMVLFLPAWCVLRVVLLRAVLQTGTLCRRCAYQMAGLAAATACPECGAIPPHQRPTTAWGRLGAIAARTGWIIAALTLFTALVIEHSRWSREVKPDLEVLIAFGSVQSAHGEVYTVDASNACLPSFARVAVRPLDAASGAVLVLGLSEQPGHGPRAQLYVGLPTGAAAFNPFARTNPFIFCDLSDAELASVTRGLPPALERAFRRKAIDLCVAPLPVRVSHDLLGEVEQAWASSPPGSPPVQLRFSDYP